jgi:hypothetical protein
MLGFEGPNILQERFNTNFCFAQTSTGFLRDFAKYKCRKGAVFQNPYNFAAIK